MHFTVLIPSYKRPQNVEQTIRALFTLFKDVKFDWEIVVSNNPPPDQAARFKIAIDDPRVKILEPENHLPSAEENFRYGLNHCTGEYVWLLGDDDALLPYGVSQLIENLNKSDFDLLIMGSRLVKYQGELAKNSRQLTHRVLHEMPLLDFVRRTGFWYVMAAFSTNVFRRSMLDLDLFDQMLKTSKIYSHSTILIGCFHDKRFRFLNVALVDYRQNLHDAVDTGHWFKAAKAQGLKTKDFWLSGFIKLLKILMARNVFDARYLSEVIDLSVSDRFRYIDHLIIQLLQQLEMGFNNLEERFSEEEFKFVIDFLEEVAPEYYDYWLKIRAIFYGNYASEHKETLASLEKLFFGGLKFPINFLDKFVIGTSGKYTMSFHDGKYIAYDPAQGNRVKNLLMFFDFYEVPGTLLISDSLEALVEKTIEEGIFSRPSYSEGSYDNLMSSQQNMGQGGLEQSMELRALVAFLRALKSLIPKAFIKRLSMWVRRRES